MEGELKNEFGFDILDYCTYCNSPIYIGDDYIVENGNMFHTWCAEVSKTYIDPDFLDEEEENE